MTQTNLDYLFQVTAAGIPRISGASARGGDESLPFGDHFSRSSSAAQDRANSTGSQESSRPTAGARPPAPPTTQDAASASTGEPSGAAAHTQANTNDDRANTGEASNSIDESLGADANSDVRPTEEAVADKENASEEEECELPDGAEVADTNAASTAGANALVAQAELAEGANAAELDATDATGDADKTSDGESTGERKSTTALRPTLDASESDDVANQTTATSQLEGIEETENPASRRKGAKLGKKETTSDAETASKQGEVQSSKQQTTGDGFSSELGAAVASDTADKTADELVTQDRGDDSSRTTDDSRRRTTSGATSRTESTGAAQNVVVAAVADKAAVRGADSGADANSVDGATRPAAKVGAAKSDPLVNVLGRPHASGGAANRVRGAAGEEELPRVDPARFIGRVAKAFQTAHDRNGTLQLRLSPPELGSVRLELTVKEGVMTAALETETTAAHRILLDHLPALRERLAEQNIRVERFDVDVRRDGGGQADDRAAQHQQHNHQSDQPPQRRQSTPQQRLGETTATDPATINHRISNTQINVVA